MPVLERGGFSPIPFFYVMGGSLVFLFLTWHIPSVASAMMAGAVHLSIADVYYPAMLAGRVGAAGLATAGALFTLGRWGHSRLREWSALHTGGRGGTGGSGEAGGSPSSSGGRPPGSSAGPATEVSLVGATDGARAEAGVASAAARTAVPGPPQASAGTSSAEPTTPPNTPLPISRRT